MIAVGAKVLHNATGQRGTVTGFTNDGWLRITTIDTGWNVAWPERAVCVWEPRVPKDIPAAMPRYEGR